MESIELYEAVVTERRNDEAFACDISLIGDNDEIIMDDSVIIVETADIVLRRKDDYKMEEEDNAVHDNDTRSVLIVQALTSCSV